MKRRLDIRLIMRDPATYVISCRRPDGTVTWQKQLGGKASFFPLHDLTHYAVETELGYRRAFYGLLAAGWDFPDFASPWPRGKLPPEAGAAELVVGFFDAERSTADGKPMTAAELNAMAGRFCQQRGQTDPAGIPRLTDDQVSRVRRRRGELFDRWAALPTGEPLELVFELD